VLGGATNRADVTPKIVVADFGTSFTREEWNPKWGQPLTGYDLSGEIADVLSAAQLEVVRATAAADADLVLNGTLTYQIKTKKLLRQPVLTNVKAILRFSLVETGSGGVLGNWQEETPKVTFPLDNVEVEVLRTAVEAYCVKTLPDLAKVVIEHAASSATEAVVESLPSMAGIDTELEAGVVSGTTSAISSAPAAVEEALPSIDGTDDVLEPSAGAASGTASSTSATAREPSAKPGAETSSGSGMKLQAVALTDRPVPGLREGDALQFFHEAVINDLGEVAFTGFTRTRDSGLWVGTPGDLRFVARRGDPAPGIVDDRGLTEFERLRWDPQGRLLFVAPAIGVYRLGNEGLELILASEKLEPEDESVPRGDLGSLIISRDGTLAFIRAGSDVVGGPPGKLRVLARAGQPAPGMPGLFLGAFGQLRSAGEYVVFPATVTGPGASGIMGLWLAGVEGIERITCPDSSDIWEPPPQTHAVNEKGEILVGCNDALWVGRPRELRQLGLTDGSPARGGVGTFLGDDRLFLREPDRALLGQPGSFTTVKWGGGGSAGFVSPDGKFVLRGHPIQEKTFGIWIWDSGPWRLIAGMGRTVTVGPGDLRKISALEFVPPSSRVVLDYFSDGHVINGAGEAVFMLAFEAEPGVRDQTSGLFMGGVGRSGADGKSLDSTSITQADLGSKP
jgi:hypothetical protein